MKKNQRQHKACSGCGDHFTTYRNYDYCVDCAVNGNRYAQNNCPECGDGSGIIKFRNQKPRPCKLCALTNKTMSNTKKKPKLSSEEKFWDEVDKLAQDKIYQLFTKNIPFQNIQQITESYRYEDRQHELTGLFLHRDVDYRTLLADLESQYDEENLPSAESLAEEVALFYCQLAIKAIISDLNKYSVYDPTFFQNLT